MTGILLDIETGGLYLDDNNNTTEISNQQAFKQIITGLFTCERGSELLNPYYGFPLTDAIRNSGIGDSEMYFESLIADTLSSQYEKLIGDVDYIRAKKDGREMNIDISVKSVLGDNIRFQETIQI